MVWYKACMTDDVLFLQVVEQGNIDGVAYAWVSVNYLGAERLCCYVRDGAEWRYYAGEPEHEWSNAMRKLWRALGSSKIQEALDTGTAQRLGANNTATIKLRLPDELAEVLREQADQEGVSLSEHVRRVITEQLQKYDD